MASISKGPGGYRTIQFVAGEKVNGKSKRTGLVLTVYGLSQGPPTNLLITFCVISGALFQRPVSSDSPNAQIMLAALKTSPAPMASIRHFWNSELDRHLGMLRCFLQRLCSVFLWALRQPSSKPSARHLNSTCMIFGISFKRFRAGGKPVPRFRRLSLRHLIAFADAIVCPSEETGVGRYFSSTKRVA